MNVAILHDALTDDSRPDETDALVQARFVAGALAELGHESVTLPATLDLAALSACLEADRPDVVFNLVETLAGRGRLAHVVPALLDGLGIPYTGSMTQPLYLTTGKLRTKARLTAGGIRTPGWCVPRRPLVMPAEPHNAAVPVTPDAGPGTAAPAHLQDESTAANGSRYDAGESARAKARGSVGANGPALPPRICYPATVIIKPVWEDASVGIDDDAIVRVENEAELADVLSARRASSGLDLFAEVYVEGREFNLSMLCGRDGPQVLPVAEIEFIDYPAEKPRIVGYAAKWDERAFEYHATPRRFEFRPADAPLLDQLRTLAVRCWQQFDLHGYVRVDFRVDAWNEPWVLEINANPCLSPDAGFMAAATQAGLTIKDVVARILGDATDDA